MQKVLVLTSTYPRYRGDTTPAFVHHLTEQLSSSFEMQVLAPHAKGAKFAESWGKVHISRFPYFFPFSSQKLCYNGGIVPNMRQSVLAKIQLPFLVASEFFCVLYQILIRRPQIIHAHWMLPQGFVAALLRLLTKAKLIVTIHGSDLYALHSNFLKSLQRFSLDRADAITINSPATEEELLSRFPHLKGKTRIIPMGVNTRHFRPRDLDKPSTLAKKRIILYVGRLSDQKGVHYLIDAMPFIQRKQKNTVLAIVGEGAYKTELEKRAYEAKAHKSVIFLGAKSQEEIAHLYNSADVTVLPSISTQSGTEGLGLSLIEAMASGSPVVGTDVGGIPFVVTHKKTGLIVEQRDAKALAGAIGQILQNQTLAKKLSKAAMMSVRKRFSWESVGGEFSSLYTQLLRKVPK